MSKRIAIGLVATCQHGLTGLILSVQKVGKNPKVAPRTLYKGICLDAGRVGQVWQSLNPKPIGTLDEWVLKRSEELKVAAFNGTVSCVGASLADARRELMSCSYPTPRNLK